MGFVKGIVLLLLAYVTVLCAMELDGKNKAEAKGVILLDSMTYPILLQAITRKTNVMIGIFDKKQTAKDSKSLETIARNNYLNFVLDVSRDAKNDVKNLIFAQIIVNG